MDITTDKHPTLDQTHASPRGLALGIGLTVVGAVWLLWNFNVLDGFWVERYGILLLGLALIGYTIYTKSLWLFPGLFLGGIGGFHLYLDYQPAYAMRDLWPMYFVIMGVAFLVNYAVDMRRWMSLLAGLFTAGIGAIWLGRELFELDINWVGVAHVFWPLLFILAGCIMVVVTIIRRKGM